MNKQTKKFKVVTEEHLIFTHEIEVPIKEIEEEIEHNEWVGDDIEFMLEHWHELIDYPDMKTKTITNVEWVNFDPQIDIEEITDE